MTSFISDSSDSSYLGADETWETELEVAILRNAEFSEIKSFCQLRPVPDRLRRDFWRLCIRVRASPARMSSFMEIFDLPNQNRLHKACKSAATGVIDCISKTPTVDTNCSNDYPTVLQLTSDFESVLTHFSKIYSVPFEPENGWVSMLSTLYTGLFPIDRGDLFFYFTSVCHYFVPDDILWACGIFRLLLQYHEPELCHFLDSYKLSPEVYAKFWFESLFSGHLSNESVCALWDIYFLQGEQQFGMMVALVLLVNAKNILMIKNSDGKAIKGMSLEDSEGVNVPDKQTGIIPKSRDEILVELRNLPKSMQPSDMAALVEITQVYSRKTPSFHANYMQFLFGAPNPEVDSHPISGVLSLLVSVEDVLKAQSVPHRLGQSLQCASAEINMELELEESSRFLLVDCRPADQYNAGHLATAFYLDTELMLSNPLEFNASVQALLQTQQRGIASGSSAVGEHIVFMGSGRLAEDPMVNMVVAHFLRLNTPYVSMVDGGYTAFHQALGPLDLNRLLVSHEEDLCLVCAAIRGQQASFMARKRPPSLTSTIGTSSLAPYPNTPRSAPIPPPAQPLGSVLSKLSNLLKKSATDASKSPQPTSTVASISSTKPVSYRNTSAVFSIDDNDDEDDESSEFPPLPNRPLPIKVFLDKKSRLSVVKNLEDCTPGQLLDLQTCREIPGVTNSFDCMFLAPDEMQSCRGVILLTEKFVIVARERRRQLFDALGNFVQKALSKATEAERHMDGVIEVSFPISQLTKITSNKVVPEVITLHCNNPVSGTHAFVRLHIPKAGDAVKTIKTAVFHSVGIS